MAQILQSPKVTAFKFLQTNKSAALATISSNHRPHVATVYYLVDKKLNLYFVTGIESIKFANLIRYPYVAMAISQDNPRVRKTLQLSGLASRIDNIYEEQEIIEHLWKKTGRTSAVPFLMIYNSGQSNELAVIKVKPYEMTLAKFSTSDSDLKQKIFTPIIRHRQPLVGNR